MRYCRIVGILLWCILPTAGRAAAQPQPSFTESFQRVKKFVESQMTGPMGAIHVNAVTNRVEKTGEARNAECLSETIGQRMELALLEKDRAAFDQQLDLVLKKFLQALLINK